MDDRLNALFAPTSVAIVGATDDASRIGGGLILHFLKRHGFTGAIYPVNPKRETVQGLPCFSTLAAVPGPIDLAIMAIPAKAVRDTVDSLPAGHTRILLVIASGFAEQGDKGALDEADLVTTAHAKGMTLVGSNSVGIVNLHENFVATISQFFDRDENPAGNIALVSQSGAFGTALLAQAALEGLDFGMFVSSGNEADLDLAEAGSWLVDRPEIDVVCAYVESIKSGSSFVEFARKANAANKPVVALKVGTSDAGARAAKLHTGALAGSDRVTNAVFEMHNVLRVADGEALIDTLKVFTRTPASRGKRLGILSHSGGAGVIAADAAEANGAILPPLPEDLCDMLQAKLPDFATFANPLDMTGGASLQGALMADCLGTILEHDAFDAALLAVNLIWRDGAVLLEALSRLAEECSKPFAVAWVAPNIEIAAALRDAPFPVFSDPGRAAHALTRRLVFDERQRTTAQEPAPIRSVGPFIPQIDHSIASQMNLLSAYGIALPRETIAGSIDEARDFFREASCPVVLKVASPDIAHRAELGAVITNVSSLGELENSYQRILSNVQAGAPHAQIDGVIIQDMIEGQEASIGIKRDPVFGPIIAVGAGGTLVELIDDIALRPAPISHAQALAMIAKTRLHRLIAGFRGRPPLDGHALAAMAERLSWLAFDNPEIAELDLNPVMIGQAGKGCVAVDYKMVWAENAG